MAEVHNLATNEYRSYSCSPAEAVIAAYAQEQHDGNTWDYARRYSHLLIAGKRTVACGDWCCMRTTSGGKAMPIYKATYHEQAQEATGTPFDIKIVEAADLIEAAKLAVQNQFQDTLGIVRLTKIEEIIQQVDIKSKPAAEKKARRGR